MDNYKRTPKLLASKGFTILPIFVADGANWHLADQGPYRMGHLHNKAEQPSTPTFI